MNIVGPWEIKGLEPATSGFVFARLQVLETLVNIDPSGRALPGLAARWDVSGDQREWRFVLRAAARFHDGSPVQADHVAHMIRRAAAQPGPLAAAPIAHIHAQPGAVIVKLTTPFRPLHGVLSHSSAAVLAPTALDARGAVSRIVGSGPFQIVSLQPPHSVDIESAPTYDGPAPAIRRVAYLAVGRAETRALLAEARQADIAFGLDPASQQRIARARHLQVASASVPRTMLIKVNAGHRWLDDPRARLAISLALDREGIARALLRSPDLAATQLFSPALTAWHAPGLPPLRRDPARALWLWRELGWRQDKDGMLRREGQQLSLSLRTFPDRPELPLVAAAIQEQLRQTGIAVRVAIGNSSEVPARHHDGSLELALIARQYGLSGDPLGTLLQDFGERGGDWGAMNWRSVALGAALQELAARRAGDDTAHSAALRARVAAIIHESLPVIPVAWYRQTAAVSPRVEGFSIDPLERSYRLDELRLTKDAIDERTPSQGGRRS